MKKVVSLLLISALAIAPAIAKIDKTSSEYLKNKKHFAIANPFAEKVAQKIIKNNAQKTIGKGKYKVKFDAYTLGSLKKGIFKNLEIQGIDLIIQDIPVTYLNLKTITDYNWIDFNENPIKIKGRHTEIGPLSAFVVP